MAYWTSWVMLELLNITLEMLSEGNRQPSIFLNLKYINIFVSIYGGGANYLALSNTDVLKIIFKSNNPNFPSTYNMYKT